MRISLPIGPNLYIGMIWGLNFEENVSSSWLKLNILAAEINKKWIVNEVKID